MAQRSRGAFPLGVATIAAWRCYSLGLDFTGDPRPRFPTLYNQRSSWKSHCNEKTSSQSCWVRVCPPSRRSCFPKDESLLGENRGHSYSSGCTAAELDKDYADLEDAFSKLQTSERDAKAATQYAEAKISTLVAEKTELQAQVRCWQSRGTHTHTHTHTSTLPRHQTIMHIAPCTRTAGCDVHPGTGRQSRQHTSHPVTPLPCDNAR